MSPKGKKGTNSDEGDKDYMEIFMETYLSSYRDFVGGKDIDERHLPSFYKGFPFVIEVYKLPNKGVCALFKKSNRSRTVVVEGDFSEIRDKIEEKAFDFMQSFPPYTNFIDDEAERLSQINANRDLSESRRMELLAGTECHLEEVVKDVDKMLQLNPWLDEQATNQMEKVGKARELIQELYKEIEIDADERFVRYERELMEIQAFEKAEIEEIAGEVEEEVETAIGEMEEQMTEVEEQMGKLEDEFDEFRTGVNTGLDDMRKTIAEMSIKLDTMQKAGLPEEEIEADMKKFREEVREMNTKVNKVDKDLQNTFKELKISEEIKDTVFRDSKRVHNLNERLGDMEKQLKDFTSKKKRDYDVEIKALVKRFDKLDTELTKKVKKAVSYEFEKQLPPPPVEEQPPETPPKGAKVKKTTVKKTTKRRKTKKS